MWELIYEKTVWDQRVSGGTRLQDPPFAPRGVGCSSPLLVTVCAIISEVLYGTSCLQFLQNSSNPVAVSAAALLGSSSLEELQQQTQMPGLGDKQPAKI